MLDFSMYVSILAGLSFALIYSVILAWYSKKFVYNLSWQDKFCWASGRGQAPFWNICFLSFFFLNQRKKRSYTKREDPRKTATTLVAYRTVKQQSTRLNLKMNLTNEKNKVYNV